MPSKIAHLRGGSQPAPRVITSANAISIKNLWAGYEPSHPILQNLNMNVARGSITVLSAPNGSGKTTLFRSILGLMKYQGEITILGKPAQDSIHSIGYVPQRSSANWAMPLSALEVVTSGLYHRIGRFVTSNHRLEAKEYLARLGLLAKAEVPIGNLSGGEQQRVMLARALAVQPAIYLVDEPFNNIDKASEKLLLRLFDQLRESGNTVFCIDHQPERMADATLKTLA